MEDCPVYGTERCWCDRDRKILCSDHSQHANQLLHCSTGGSNEDSAFFKSIESNEVVANVQVATEEDICEWFGVCSLKFIRMLDDNSLQVEDGKGTSFIIPYDATISYELAEN